MEAVFAILYEIIGHLFYAILALFFSLIAYFIGQRHTSNRDFSQIIGTYLSFNRTIGQEDKNMTVNIIIFKMKKLRYGVDIRFLNGVEFKDGKLSVMYSYRGYIKKGDPEFYIYLRCDQLREDVVGIIPAANSSFQLCPWIFLVRSFSIRPYAGVGVIIGQDYFIRNIQNKGISEYLNSAFDFVIESKSNPFFIHISRTQHECLNHFRKIFQFQYTETINGKQNFIRAKTYDKNKFNDFGPHVPVDSP